MFARMKEFVLCSHFYKILFLHNHNLTYDDLAFGQGCAMKHQNCMSNSNNGKRLVVIIEIFRNISEDSRNRLYLACEKSFPGDSEVIVTSQLDKIVKFETIQALSLEYVSHEAYLYFPRHLHLQTWIPR